MSSTQAQLPAPAQVPAVKAAEKPKLPARAPAQKAAAVLALLDDATLTALAGRLPERHRDRLMNSVMSLRTVTVPEQQKIAQEFMLHFKQQQHALRGTEGTASRLASRLFAGDDEAPALEEVLEEAEEDDAEPKEMTVWDKIAEVPVDKLVDFFADKPAAILSITLQKLPEDIASEVTGALPEDLARQGMLQIATSGAINPLAIEAVEQLLDRQLLTEAEGDDGGGKNLSTQKIANILNRLTSTRREAIMTGLKETLSEEEVREIISKVLSFEALEDRLPRNGIPILFREVPEKLILVAIKYALAQDMPVGEYLMKNISQRMAAQYREKMDDMAEVNTEEGEKAQSAAICKVLEMAEDGRVTLLEANAEAE